MITIKEGRREMNKLSPWGSKLGEALAMPLNVFSRVTDFVFMIFLWSHAFQYSSLATCGYLNLN